MTRPVTLGLVGCGRLAESGYLPALAHTQGVRIGAVADPDSFRRAHIAALAGASEHRDAADLLELAPVDGLVVASPVAAHLADAALAAEVGVPSLVEKPPAIDADQASALPPSSWVGFNRRFDEGARAMRDVASRLGEVQVDLEIAYRRRSWGAHLVHDDALLDLGPHLIDWARWLTSSEVTAVERARLEPSRAAVDLRLERGRARIRAATDRFHTERIRVRDAAGSTVAEHTVGGVVAGVIARLRPARPSLLVATLAAQLDAFTAAIRGRAPSELGTVADGVAVMAVIDATRTAAATGRSTTPSTISTDRQEI